MASFSHRKETFRISPIDCHGRIIEPKVIAVAQDIAGRIRRYAEKLHIDPAVAISVLEESAAAVSGALRRKPGFDSSVDDLHAYLFRAFLRKMNRVQRKELRLAVYLSGQNKDFELFDPSRELEMRILIDELLMRSNAATRDMFYRRTQGFSWKEIGRAYGISAHAAESRFSLALKRLRQLLRI
jgi:DNA-directed RNA polymerase specialized sigma24 family protein